MKSYTVFDFYLGDSDEDATESWQTSEITTRPIVGEKMRFWSTRDGRGNYVHESVKLVFEGIVTRIEHIIEERGHNSRERHHAHFVRVFMKPVESSDE
jgi:hypothetical protein